MYNNFIESTQLSTINTSHSNSKNISIEVCLFFGSHFELITELNLYRYTKYVKKEISKAERLLKAIIQSPAGLVQNFKAMFPDEKEPMFQKILDLKVCF
jgi:hypothetical protein